MKKGLLLLVSIFLLGSSAVYAQPAAKESYPTTTTVSVAVQELIDALVKCAREQIKLEDYMKDNKGLFSVDNIHELIMAAREEAYLAKSRSLLSLAVKIIDTGTLVPRSLDANNEEMNSFYRLLGEISGEVYRRPVNHLTSNLLRCGLSTVTTGPLGISEENINEALKFFISKDTYSEDDMKAILGDPKDEFESGLLFQASKEIDDGAERRKEFQIHSPGKDYIDVEEYETKNLIEIQQNLKTLTTLLLCSDNTISFFGKKGTVGDIAVNSVDANKTLGEPFKKIDRSAFSIGETAIIKIDPKNKDVTKGLQRFDAIKAIIEKK